MARVQYGTIVTEIKGKNQGHVFQGGNVGFVLRSKGYTKGIGSNTRKAANNVLASNASRWRDLTDGQRAQWSALAPDWLFYNKFGAAYQGSGFQIFCSYTGNAQQLLNFGVTAPNPVASPTDPGTMSVESFNDGTLNVAWVTGFVAPTWITVFAAAPMSAGRNTNHPRVKFIARFEGNGDMALDIYAAFVAMYGVPQLGQRIVVTVKVFNFNFPYPFFVQNLTTITTTP